MSKINILYSSHTTDMTLGGQISLYNLVKRLNRERYHPTLVCPSSGPLSRAFAKIGCDIVFIAFPHISFRNIARVPVGISRALKLLSTNKVDIVHSDHPTDTFYLALCARILKIPVIWHARVTFNSRLDIINAKLVSRIIGVSKAVFVRFKTVENISFKYRTVYNGVNYAKFRPGITNSIREELGVSSGKTIVTTIGQIKPEKGISDFITAAELIFEKDKTFRFLIVGEGNASYEMELIDRIKGLGLKNHITFLGFRTDIDKILNASDIFVLASSPNLEGLPRVVIEAMACGKPVVGTDVQGTNEAVKDGVTGLLVPPSNPYRLAEAILMLSKNKERLTRMGNAGRERVIDLFSIDNNVQQIQKVYEELVSDKNRSQIDNRDDP